MNTKLRIMFFLPIGAVKMGMNKLMHGKKFSGHPVCMCSPFSEISVDWGAEAHIGKMLRLRDGAKIRVRKGAYFSIGEDSYVNSNVIITCRESITIGASARLSPGVQIYDHDHDFSCPGGVAANKFKTSPVEIGNNVWLGANVVVTRGSKIGDNCVVGSNTVVSGTIPPNSIVYQERSVKLKTIEVRE